MPYLDLPTHRNAPLRKASLTIGSDPSCDLSIKGESVAPRHLILQSRGDGWQVATLDLHAQVTVNNEPITGLRLLQDGDRIRVGDMVFVWHETEAPAGHGPWLGLLLIFLSVIAALSILFTIYRFDTTYLDNFIPTSLTPKAIQPSPPSSEMDATLAPATISPSERPVYHLILPPVEGRSP